MPPKSGDEPVLQGKVTLTDQLRIGLREFCFAEIADREVGHDLPLPGSSGLHWQPCPNSLGESELSARSYRNRMNDAARSSQRPNVVDQRLGSRGGAGQ